MGIVEIDTYCGEQCGLGKNMMSGLYCRAWPYQDKGCDFERQKTEGIAVRRLRGTEDLSAHRGSFMFKKIARCALWSIDIPIIREVPPLASGCGCYLQAGLATG